MEKKSTTICTELSEVYGAYKWIVLWDNCGCIVFVYCKSLLEFKNQSNCNF